MLSPEEQEKHIRMVKDAQNNINTKLSDQVLLLLGLDTETQKLYDDLKKLSQDFIKIDKEYEDVIQINVKLVAKRIQRLRKGDAFRKELKCEQEQTENDFQLFKEQQLKHEELVMQYEDIMQGKANELREMAFLGNKHEVEEKITETKLVIQGLKDKEAELEKEIENIKDEIQIITCNILDKFLDIVGNTELENYFNKE